MTIDSAVGEAAIEAHLKQFLLVLSVSLTVATLPQVLRWFRQIPYTLLLVIVGTGLAFLDVRLVDLSPALILTILLPPLLFEAAWNLKWSDLKRDLLPICLYAIVGVGISIAGVALGLNQLAGMSLTTALLIGASLSATDPVSVTALFRELGVSKRLSVLMEGESLFNDGMAVVAFSLLVALPLGTANLGVQSVLTQLFTVVGIGLAVGSVVGFGISYVTQRFDLPLVEQSITLVSAYGTYLVTEELGGSGVIAVVSVGLILGNFGSRIGMSPRTRVIVSEFWEFLSFFVNSIVFLLIGDQIHFDSVLNNSGIIAITIAGMVVARAIATFVLSSLCNRFAPTETISLPQQTVLWWGGLRGAVSIALALSVPTVIAERETVIATVFGVVLFTLLAQGLTVKPLLQWLNLLGDQPMREEYLELVARNVALDRALQHLQADTRPGIEPEFYRYQEALLKGESETLKTKIETLRDEYPDLRDFMAEQLRGELLAIEADTYAEFVRAGRLNKELVPLLEDVLQGEEK
ncbi:MAG: sodium:proton antiporter [Drouetiella hepatica Uher 2000/2452]|jgi:CPA1 family monovalent cation:H+ antiporter|uniref:Sodium:proton antiporter n=1 Tax=Drouetiella hepatica Uher 2000/2452 TaxID=904376 RepID=A0A951Q7K6_9CYAN|nr:sodium:proton antiporter [Drouetiella hepatica Uher 2000/2452]